MMTAQASLFADAMQQMNALPRPVQLWMRWLNIVFLPVFFFLGSHEDAALVLAVFILQFPVGALIFYYTRDIRMTGVPHILFWTPLTVYLLVFTKSPAVLSLPAPYAIWVLLLGLTMVISVFFDLKGLLSILFFEHKA